jgi:hypothetical protein
MKPFLVIYISETEQLGVVAAPGENAEQALAIAAKLLTERGEGEASMVGVMDESGVDQAAEAFDALRAQLALQQRG